MMIRHDITSDKILDAATGRGALAVLAIIIGLGVIALVAKAVVS
jgi:predicted RNA methylase